MPNTLHSGVDILLVEDNLGDARLVRKAFDMRGSANRISHVTDGEEALDFLYMRGEYRNAPRPDIILLDLNMPGVDGREVLAEVKSNPELSSIPVIVMTSSTAGPDIVESYRLHVNCYIKKPLQVLDFLSAVKAIDEFWINTVCLPRQAIV